MLGIGAHTDYECFTVLRQYEGVEALQVLNKQGVCESGCFRFAAYNQEALTRGLDLFLLPFLQGSLLLLSPEPS